MSNSFPRISQWAADTLYGTKKEEFEQYLWNVSYHLNHAKNARYDCSEKLWSFNWLIHDDTRTVSFTNLEEYALSIVYSGDTAIREAVSAIDTALILVNHVLGLGVDQQKIGWKDNPQSPKDKSHLQKAILNLNSSQRNNLYTAIDQVFKSIGYELLQGYRNWITHRGSPHFDDSAITQPIPILEQILSVNDSTEMKHQLLRVISSQLYIKCYPFVPPIHSGSKFGGTQMRLRIGDLNEDAVQFKQNNPATLEENIAKIAGEDLAVYSVSDYTNAVSEVVKFAEKALTDKWDEELYNLCC